MASHKAFCKLNINRPLPWCNLGMRVVKFKGFQNTAQPNKVASVIKLSNLVN